MDSRESNAREDLGRNLEGGGTTRTDDMPTHAEDQYGVNGRESILSSEGPGKGGGEYFGAKEWGSKGRGEKKKEIPGGGWAADDTEAQGRRFIS